MAGTNLYCNHYFPVLLLLIIFTNCKTIPDKRNPAVNLPELPQWTTADSFKINGVTYRENPKDQVVFIENGARNIKVSSSTAMNDILSFTGCMNGFKAEKLLSHVTEGTKDSWIILCKNNNQLAEEEVIFHLIGVENKIQEFQATRELLKKANHEFKKNRESAIAQYTEIIKREPALPLARFRLGIYELHNNNCSQAIRHLRIFFRLHPSFKHKNTLFATINNKCKLS